MSASSNNEHMRAYTYRSMRSLSLRRNPSLSRSTEPTRRSSSARRCARPSSPTSTTAFPQAPSPSTSAVRARWAVGSRSSAAQSRTSSSSSSPPPPPPPAWGLLTAMVALCGAAVECAISVSAHSSIGPLVLVSVVGARTQAGRQHEVSVYRDRALAWLFVFPGAESRRRNKLATLPMCRGHH